MAGLLNQCRSGQSSTASMRGSSCCARTANGSSNGSGSRTTTTPCLDSSVPQRTARTASVTSGGSASLPFSRPDQMRFRLGLGGIGGPFERGGASNPRRTLRWYDAYVDRWYIFDKAGIPKRGPMIPSSTGT